MKSTTVGRFRNSLLTAMISLVFAAAWAQRPAPARALPDASAPRGMRLTATAVRNSWIRARTDGRQAFAGTLKAGRSVTWTAKKVVRLTVGDAAAVRLTLNGKTLAPLGRRGQVVSRVYFAPKIVAQPTPKPVPAPVPAAIPPPKPVPPISPVLAPPKPSPKIVVTPKKAPHPAVVSPSPSADTSVQSLRKYLTEPYTSIAALVILLALSFWIFVMVRRERMGLSDIENPGGRAPGGICVVASKRLGRGKEVYLLEINGQLFIVGVGGVELFGRVPTERSSGRKTLRSTVRASGVQEAPGGENGQEDPDR